MKKIIILIVVTIGFYSCSNELDIKNQKESVEIEVSKYDKLRQMNVDLSSYMVALAKGKPDQWIQLENGGNNDKVTPHIHVQRK